MAETLRAVAYVSGGTPGVLHDRAILTHDERRVRRRLIRLVHGDEVLVDFPAPVTLEQHGLLQLENGKLVEVIAGDEALYEIRGRDPAHLMQLCWHIGNRHAKAQIREQAGGDQRILILRDHVLGDMLRGLGATLRDVSEPFSPEEGAYGHDHGHALLNR